jgi:hypothetical protein
MKEANVNMGVRMTAYYFVPPGKILIPGRSNEEKNIF